MDEIHKNLSENTSVTKYTVDGKESWTQDNLIYTGSMKYEPSFPIGIDSVEETDKEGNTVNKNKEVYGEVVIVEYRSPNIQDELRSQKSTVASLTNHISQVASVTGVSIENAVSETATLEELKAFKKQEINSICGQTVCAGLDVTLSTGTEHFSLSQSDQLNLFGLQAQLATGVDQIVYHADGKPCKFYTVADIKILIEKAMSHATYHVTYGNSLKMWVDTIETKEELELISYGSTIPEEYQSEVLKKFLADK